MIVPDQIRKCVAFIGYRKQDGIPHLAGTAFFVARPLREDANPTAGSIHTSFAYLLTAKHVLDKLRNKGLTEVLVRFNYLDGRAGWVSTPLHLWLEHPTEADTVDVAMIPAEGFQPSKLDHGVFPINGFVTKERAALENIGLGEETIIVGLFAHHHGNAKNIPIVRIGNIAAMPEEKVSTSIGKIDAYLLETRSIGGLSGSPVFVNLGIMRDRKGVLEVEKVVDGVRLPGAMYLLGLIHGHYDERDADTKSGVNVGIGIVVPASKILEVLNQEAVLTMEKEKRERHKSENTTTMDVLAEELEESTEEIFSTRSEGDQGTRIKDDPTLTKGRI